MWKLNAISSTVIIQILFLFTGHENQCNGVILPFLLYNYYQFKSLNLITLNMFVSELI